MPRGLFSFSCCDSFPLPISPPYCILLHAGMKKIKFGGDQRVENTGQDPGSLICIYFFFCLHLFSPLWTLQMKQKRMLLNLADRRTDITKETEVALSPNVTLSLPKTGPLEYLEISVILPRQLLDWVHFKSISIMMLASILLARAQEPTTLDSSYCKGGRMTSHQEHSLQRQHTKPGSITDILSGSCTLQSWQFFYFLL